MLFKGEKVAKVVLGRAVPSDCVDFKVVKLLHAYFKGERVDFALVEVELSVSDFARRVLEEVRLIPYGTTITYGELARRLGTKGFRAVGRALSLNPVPVIIPCHRVVSAKGLGGFTAGLEWKRFLLELEGCGA